MIQTYPDAATWEGDSILYRYYCSRRRRSLAISVLHDLSVTVRAPYGTSREQIRLFVVEHAGWILRTQRKLGQQSNPEPLSFRDGETHCYAGRSYLLEVNQGERDSVACLDNRLVVTMRQEPSEEKTKKILDAWYRRRADILFHDRLAVCHERAASEGIPLPVLRIRKMRSRWGSYSPKGVITLNLLLILFPVECLDYVVLHELCHYKVGRHGPRFWKLLKRLMPDCQERRGALNAYGRNLWKRC
jgi:predicted metal-dependent hydrolase